MLPHVESSFNAAAYSKVGAAGLWQFMRSTGRRYMRVDDAVDERLDPYRSTEAAAQLLAYNYRVLGSWPLALTAYNHGAAGMRRAKESRRHRRFREDQSHLQQPHVRFRVAQFLSVVPRRADHRREPGEILRRARAAARAEIPRGHDARVRAAGDARTRARCGSRTAARAESRPGGRRSSTARGSCRAVIACACRPTPPRSGPRSCCPRGCPPTSCTRGRSRRARIACARARRMAAIAQRYGMTAARLARDERAFGEGAVCAPAGGCNFPNSCRAR